jgi:hypothetical protein
MTVEPDRLPAAHDERRRDDAGVTLVLIALLMTAMLTVVAVVIDLGYVRGVARADQSIADMAALAGAEQLEQEKYYEACRDMIKYLNLNANGMPAIDADGFCGSMGSTVCSGGTLAQAAPSTTSGKYTVTIEFPVPDEAGAFPAMGAGTEDGVPCDRMRVTVRSVDQPFFGGIAGATEYDVVRSAVLRAGPGERTKAPALWLLEPYGCSTLRTTGGASVIVGNLDANPPIEGLITVDSDGTNCGTGGGAVIEAGGTALFALPNSSSGTGFQEWGEIRTPAMPRWATNCGTSTNRGCNQADVDAGRLNPMPTNVPRRATRAPVDHKWNCKTGYPDYDVQTVGFPTIEIPDCRYVSTPAKDEPQPRAPYIDLLRTFARSTTNAPTGWRTYPEAGHTPAHDCNVSGHVVVPVGNWFVDCDPLRVSSNNSITFQGGNVITRGGLRSSGTGEGAGIIRFNHAEQAQGTTCVPTPGQSLCHGSTAKAAWVYMRSGDIDISGTLSAKHTMIYLDHDTPGIIKLSGQARVHWTAPTEGPFAGLAGWSERRSTSYAIGGGGGVTMAGAFFTPYANAIDVGGSGAWDVRNAQYISQRINFVGGATLRMAPDPVTALTPPPRKGFLIR